MAKAKAAILLLVLLALSAALASAAASRHGRPADANDGPGLFGMPWFGGAPGGTGFFGGGGGGGGGGGWGAGGPWYRRGAVVPPSTVCAEKGPCHGKRLTCPPRCFKSFSYRGSHGGGGGCSFDCASRCVASC